MLFSKLFLITDTASNAAYLVQLPVSVDKLYLGLELSHLFLQPASTASRIREAAGQGCEKSRGNAVDMA